MKINSLIQGKKRYVAAAVAAATLGGGAFAYAASLNVSSDKLAAGSVAVTGCSDAFTASYNTAYDATISGYRVVSVVLTDTTASPTCNTETANLELTQGTSPSGVALAAADATQTITAGAATFTFNSPGHVPASAVTGVSVVVTP